MALEKTIQTNILNYLNKEVNYCVAENVTGCASQKGRPDINGCWMGRSFRIEVKSPDNNYDVTKLQDTNLRKWAKAGSICFVAYSVEDVKAIINNEDLFYKNKFTGKIYSCKGVL